jgi:hypothetical protein
MGGKRGVAARAKWGGPPRPIWGGGEGAHYGSPRAGRLAPQLPLLYKETHIGQIRYTINWRKYLSLVFFSVRFPEELQREEDNSTQYTGVQLGSGSRKSTSATLLDRSRDRRWAPYVCETTRCCTCGTRCHGRGLLHDIEVSDDSRSTPIILQLNINRYRCTSPLSSLLMHY